MSVSSKVLPLNFSIQSFHQVLRVPHVSKTVYSTIFQGTDGAFLVIYFVFLFLRPVFSFLLIFSSNNRTTELLKITSNEEVRLSFMFVLFPSYWFVFTFHFFLVLFFVTWIYFEYLFLTFMKDWSPHMLILSRKHFLFVCF